MAFVGIIKKRIIIFFWAFSSIVQPLAVSTTLVPVMNWYKLWVGNRGSIAVLTGVNTAITFSTELVTRTVSAPVTKNPRQNGFFVRTRSNNLTINRQSLINIWMTFFASIFGGVVFFISDRSKRFLFFICFGMVNSVLSQNMGNLIRDGILSFTFSRLLFDFGYTAMFKFPIFELGRLPIVRAKMNVMRVGSVRMSQDFATTFFRVSMLNFLGFKG